MLIRTTSDGRFECILQEHHAVISGVLAGAWKESRLHPLLVQAIGLHDNPWRSVDRRPRLDEERGLPCDFTGYPLDDKIDFYRRGIDELEAVHPWIAYLVSRHYTTFSGTRGLEELERPERARRERLEGCLARRLLADADTALSWVKFFDIFSLHLCLAGPRAVPEAIPRWLTDPDKWSNAPDGTDLTLRWLDDATLSVDPWPFYDDGLAVDLHYRRLTERANDRKHLEEIWQEAPVERREIALVTRSETP